MGFFEQWWSIEVLKFHLFLQYWYVWFIILIVFMIYIYFQNKF